MASRKEKHSLPQYNNKDESSLRDSYQVLSQSVSINNINNSDGQNHPRTHSFANNLQDTSLKGSLYQTQTSNLLLPQVDFVGEDKFKKDIECWVCKSPFGTMKDRQHHCRLCGNSCCHLCSSRSVNSQRVCDICFLKATQLKYEKQRNRYIKSMKEHIKKMTGFFLAGEKRILEQEQEHEVQRQRLEDETQILKNEHIDLMMNYNYQEEEKKNLINTLKNLNSQLESKNLKKEKLLAQETETDQKILRLNTSIHLKSEKLQEKRNTYERLKKHLDDIEQSESFISLSLYQEASKQEPNNMSEKIVALSNNKPSSKTQRSVTQVNFESFRIESQDPRSQSNSSQSQTLANQLYDTQMLVEGEVKQLMNKDKDKDQKQKDQQHQIKKDITQKKEWDGCQSNCRIF